MWSLQGNALKGLVSPTGSLAPGGAPNSDAGGPPDYGVSLPPMPTSFPELQKMSTQELEVLWSNEEALSKFVQNHEQMRKVDQVLEKMRKDIEELTKSNEAKLNEAHLSQSKEEAERDQRLEQELREEIAAKEEEKKKLWEFNSPQAINNRLQQALAEAEQHSERLKTQFFEQELQLNEFLRLYTSQRKRYHQIAALTENLAPYLT